jgi:integrase
MATARPKGKGYEIRASLGYDINGKKLARSVTWVPETGMTNRQIAKELERQKVLLDEKARSGLLLDGNIKFADFAEKWFTDYAEKQCKKKTLYRYKELLKRINLAIGHIQLEKLRPNHLMEFYDNLEAEGVRRDIKYKATEKFSDIMKSQGLTKVKLAPLAGVSTGVLNSCTQGKNITEKSAKLISSALKIDMKKLFATNNTKTTLADKTVLHYHRLISSILSTAVKWQVIFSNPCSRVSPPKVKRKEAKYLDEDETAHLLELLEGEPVQFQAMIKLFIYTGMRRGELCGVQWNDIDFAKSVIHMPLYMGEICTPLLSIRREPKASLSAESWFPLTIKTSTLRLTSPSKKSSNTRSASVGATVRSNISPEIRVACGFSSSAMFSITFRIYSWSSNMENS